MQNQNQLGCHKKSKSLIPRNLGSCFLVFNLILTQLEEIRKNNINWGAKKIECFHYQTSITLLTSPPSLILHLSPPSFTFHPSPFVLQPLSFTLNHLVLQKEQEFDTDEDLLVIWLKLKCKIEKVNKTKKIQPSYGFPK